MDGDVMRDAEMRMAAMGEAARTLERIDRLVEERCGTAQIQDIVGNLMMILHTLEGRARTTAALPAAQVAGVQALVEECLRLAGVPEGTMQAATAAMGDLAKGVGERDFLAAVAQDQLHP
jgi:hypothetical protein